MDSKNKIIIFDLWQTLADSALKPSDLFDNLFKLDNTISKNDFLRILFKSDLYLKDISLEKGIESFLSDLGISNKEKLETVTSIWKEMVKKSFLINGSEDMLMTLKNQGYKLCLLTNIDKYGYENFPFKDLLSLFDYQFLSYKNGLIKPDVKCWEAIKDHYKTDYKNMVMVGDSVENDMIPSKSVGLSIILIDINKKDGVYEEIYAKLIK
ncbi:MAG: HAD family hydrolase [Candidatus Zambryskibacteria bacterium]